MMAVYLRARHALRQWLNPNVDQNTRCVGVPEGGSLKEILEAIGINPALTAICYSEGKVIGFEYKPRDGQIITLHQLVSGG